MSLTLAPHTNPIQAMKHQYALQNRIEQMLEQKLPSVTRAKLEIFRHQLACDHLNSEGVYHTETVVNLMGEVE